MATLEPLLLIGSSSFLQVTKITINSRQSLIYFTTRPNLVTLTFLWEKVKTVDFSETIAACDLKVGRCRQLIEFIKVCEY